MPFEQLPIKSNKKIRAKQIPPSKRFKKISVYVCVILLFVYGLINLYNGIVVPHLVAKTMQTNIQLVNVVSLYTKEFETDILSVLQKNTIDAQDRSHITSQLDILTRTVQDSKNKLDKGFYADTREFYDLIVEAFNLFEELLDSTRQYIAYQFCFIEKYQQITEADTTKNTILTQLASRNSLYENSEIYTQLYSLYELEDQYFTDLNTCFTNDFEYLKTSEWDTTQQSFVEYTQAQRVILKQMYDSAVNQNTSEIEKGFNALAENESKHENFFVSDYYTVLMYQPLEIIGDKNKNITIHYNSIDNQLFNLKQKYNLD